MAEESEFGKGLTYCLGLFLAHAERYYMEDLKKENTGFAGKYLTWFNGSSDHLYDIQTDSIKDKKLKKRIVVFKDKCLNWGHGFPKEGVTKENMIWAVQEAKDILRLIDEKCLGVKTVKGQNE